jgi:hypothetical protein
MNHTTTTPQHSCPCALVRCMPVLCANLFDAALPRFGASDLNGDESISVSEFKEGIFSLQHILGFECTEADVDQLIRHIDKNGDESIDFGEFFSSFQIADPLLSEVQKKNQASKMNARKTGSNVPPSTTPSPVITPRSLKEAKEMKEPTSP